MVRRMKFDTEGDVCYIVLSLGNVVMCGIKCEVWYMG